MGRLSRFGLALVGAIVLVAVGGAFALGSTLSGGTVTVCVQHHGGVLYKARRCAAGDRKLSLASSTPKVVTRFTNTPITAGTDIYGDASCKAGETLTGGGFGVLGDAYENSIVIRSGINYGDKQGAKPMGVWTAGVYNPTKTGTLRVWAICMS